MSKQEQFKVEKCESRLEWTGNSSAMDTGKQMETEAFQLEPTRPLPDF